MLCQLSYAPGRFEVSDCIGGSAGIPRAVSDQEPEREQQQPTEAPPGEDDLQADQEGKGYGEDEGERADALPDE